MGCLSLVNCPIGYILKLLWDRSQFLNVCNLSLAVDALIRYALQTYIYMHKNLNLSNKGDKLKLHSQRN